VFFAQLNVELFGINVFIDFDDASNRDVKGNIFLWVFNKFVAGFVQFDAFRQL